MKTIFATKLRVIAGAVAAVSVVLFSEIAGAAELQLTKTIHVPEAVANGTAPLIGHLPASQRLSLAISLPLQNELQLDALLRRIYDPQSPDYDRYLSVEEFTDRFGPAEMDYAAVQRFARANHLSVIDIAANRMVVDVEGTAADIESAFHVKLGVYQHPLEQRTFYAPTANPPPIWM